MKTVLKISLVILVLLPLFSRSQNQEQPEQSVDSLYREDQLYFGVTYNLISSKPEGYPRPDFQADFILVLSGTFHSIPKGILQLA